MNSPSVKQRTSLMFVTLMCYGSRSRTSQLLHTKRTFCLRLQINILASAGEWFYEYEWICSRVQVNSLAGRDELARGHVWTCSRVRVNLLASPSRVSATLHLSGTVASSMESKFLDLKQCMKPTKVMISHAKTPSVYNNVAK